MVVTANGRFAIYAIAVSDGQSRSVTEAEGVSEPSWSADGATISFLARVPRGGEEPYDVFTVPAAGGKPRRVLGPANTLAVAATDAGRWLVQRIVAETGGHALILADADGELDRMILPDVGASHLVDAALAPCGRD